MRDQHHPGKCHPTAGQPEWVPQRACALPSGVVGALYLVSFSSVFLFLPHLPFLGNVKMYPPPSWKRGSFLVQILPLNPFFIYHHPLGSLHLPLHLLQKKSVGRVAGRAAAETADGMTEQNSLCVKWEVHRAVSWLGNVPVIARAVQCSWLRWSLKCASSLYLSDTPLPPNFSSQRGVKQTYTQILADLSTLVDI